MQNIALVCNNSGCTFDSLVEEPLLIKGSISSDGIGTLFRSSKVADDECIGNNSTELCNIDSHSS